MSKSELILTIVEEHSNKLTRKDVKEVLESLANVGYKELKKTGAFLVPGFAKFIVVRKPATKARKGINPFTKEPMVFKAKPARKVLKARPVKAAKDALPTCRRPAGRSLWDRNGPADWQSYKPRDREFNSSAAPLREADFPSLFSNPRFLRPPRFGVGVIATAFGSGICAVGSVESSASA